MKKTKTLPPVRASPKDKRLIESVLKDDESLSSFMLESTLRAAQVRREQRDFIALGMKRLAEYRRTGKSYSPEEVMDHLKARLEAAKRRRASGA